MTMQALVIVADAALADDLSEALLDDCGALAVTIEDADAGTPDERAVFDEPGVEPAAVWRRARVTAQFADAAAAAAAADAVRALGDGVESTRVEPIDDADWVRGTQAGFAPVEVADRFWIVPTWCDVPAGARHVVRLDPGLAFGTGTHPTTRLCLSWLAARDGAAWSRVLDYGTGSGILAIAALRLGAGSADAVDVDPVAVQTAAANAALNGVVLRAGAPELARGVYPLVVANILSLPLQALAPLLAAHVEPGGDLLLSGILERQVDALRDAYAPWLALDVAGRDDGWVSMHARRPREPMA